MRSRLRENLPALTGATLGILIVGWLGLTDWAWTDYDSEARPAFDALVSGHLLQFLRLVPAYGGSLVMRAPFVFVPKLWGGGELAIYRAAAAPCLLASAVLGVWLVARMRSSGRSQVARAAALMLCVANPMTLSTLESGHPEELLGAVLCVAAVLAALRNRAVWAGVLLGLAVANQEWAIVAAGPVLIALSRHRIRAVLTSGAVASALLLPLVVAGGLVTQLRGASTPGSSIFTPWQLWWFVGPHRHVIPAGQPWNTRFDPAWLTQLAHPLIVAIALPLSLLCAHMVRRRPERRTHDALLLLVLLLLLRCALDPWDNWYYPLPFLVALLAWETLTAQRPPLVALVASFAAWVLFQWAVPSRGFSPDMQSLLFLLLTVPGLIMIILTLYLPGAAERLRVRWGRGTPVPSPA
jgi:Glycosyltransferase family 87